MNRKFILAGSLLLAFVFAVFHFYSLNARQKQQPAMLSNAGPSGSSTLKDKIAQPKIQVVFALDATGSMRGLIAAAKEKIWSIAGSMAQADPSPVVEVGLLFYRDRGDAFITKQIPLSKDMDAVYEKLMQISADGGGDEPESVNQALHEAVTNFGWDTDSSTYRTVFLVGDCPPHMDYRNDVPYPVSCTDAKHKDIVLNTILMGNNSTAKRIWTEIANCSQGSFTEVNMSANDITVNTPYDSVIAVVSDQLDDTRMYYGTEKDKAVGYEKISKSKFISGNTQANVKAQRAEFNTTKTGKESYYGSKELLEEYRTNKNAMDVIKQEDLPAEMKNMSPEQKKIFIEQRLAKRDSLNQQMQKYTRLRQEYIEKDLAGRKAGEVDSSFSNKVYKSIQKQTEKKNIKLKEKAKF